MERVFFCFLLTVFLSHFKISFRDLSILTNCRTRRQKMSWIMGEGKGPASISVGRSGQSTPVFQLMCRIQNTVIFPSKCIYLHIFWYFVAENKCKMVVLFLLHFVMLNTIGKKCVCISPHLSTYMDDISLKVISHIFIYLITVVSSDNQFSFI